MVNWWEGPHVHMMKVLGLLLPLFSGSQFRSGMNVSAVRMSVHAEWRFMLYDCTFSECVCRVCVERLGECVKWLEHLCWAKVCALGWECVLCDWVCVLSVWVREYVRVCMCWVTESMLSDLCWVIAELTECVLSDWSVEWDSACWVTECVCDWPWRRTWWPGTAWWSRTCRWCHWCSHLHWSVPATRSAPVAEQHKKDYVTSVNTCTDQYPQHDLFLSLSNTKRMSLHWSVPATWSVPVAEQHKRDVTGVNTCETSTHDTICSSRWATQKGCHWC